MLSGMETAASDCPVYRITIPGLLRAKGRPRFGNGRTFTDAKTVQAEKHIQRHAVEQIGKPCLTGPLHVSLWHKFGLIDTDFWYLYIWCQQDLFWSHYVPSYRNNSEGGRDCRCRIRRIALLPEARIGWPCRNVTRLSQAGLQYPRRVQPACEVEAFQCS